MLKRLATLPLLLLLTGCPGGSGPTDPTHPGPGDPRGPVVQGTIEALTKEDGTAASVDFELTVDGLVYIYYAGEAAPEVLEFADLPEVTTPVTLQTREDGLWWGQTPDGEIHALILEPEHELGNSESIQRIISALSP